MILDVDYYLSYVKRLYTQNRCDNGRDRLTSSSSPFSFTISALTASQGSLSSLSMAEQMVRNFAAGTPHKLIMPSSSRLWLIFTVKTPRSKSSRISVTACRHMPALGARRSRDELAIV